MKATPTAEEFGNSMYQLGTESCKEFAIRMAKEFAKLHVKAALEEAAKRVDLSLYKKSQYSKRARWKKVSQQEAQEGVDIFAYEVQYKPSRASILKAYPENRIR